MGKIEILRRLRPLLDSFRDLLPIIIVVSFFQLFVLQQPIPNWPSLLLGTLFVLIGLTLFIRGLDLALFPIGAAL